MSFSAFNNYLYNFKVRLFVNRNELINYIILNSKISLEDITHKIGVNRSNIYLWRIKKQNQRL